jgi:hypothetical protein
VEGKYIIAKVPLEQRWNLIWRRDFDRENALYALLVKGIGKYKLVHDTTHTGKFIDVHGENIIYFNPVATFNVFDWYKVITNATEIHCID